MKTSRRIGMNEWTWRPGAAGPKLAQTPDAKTGDII